YQYGPACILPNLYLGASYNAENTQQLHRLDVTSIINVASEINLPPASNKLEYHHIRWTHNQHNLDFNRVIQIIYTAHSKNQVVLVHCQQGIERSATLVLAYLIYLSRQNWSLDHAISYVQKRAPAIRPNMNQLYQLREYE
ncbi:DSPc-domain-containing protein, partial [Backusella circina FSU 941]